MEKLGCTTHCADAVRRETWEDEKPLVLSSGAKLPTESGLGSGSATGSRTAQLKPVNHRITGNNKVLF